MAPTNHNGIGSNNAIVPNEDNESPKIYSRDMANMANMANISTVSSDYNKLNKAQEDTCSSNIRVGPQTTPHTRLEMDDRCNKRYKLCNKPCNHDFKKCIHSFQSLPPKTRQTLRILAIALVSVVALVGIFYVARLAEKQDYEGNEIFEHNMAETLQFDQDNGPIMGAKQLYPRLEYGVGSNRASSKGLPYHPKIIKDSNGKAHFIDSNGHHVPIMPKRYPEGISLDIARKKIRQGLRHPANASEVAETLKIIRKTVDADRKLISNKEIKFWEIGSEPLRILLVSTWRSGSTFLAQLLQSHPGVYEHYEPFSYLGVQQIRSGKEAFQAQQMLHRLLDCEYEGLSQYNNYTKNNLQLMVGYNKRVWEACNKGPNMMACAEPNMLTQACEMFPIQLVKTVRLRLNITQLLLNDHKLKVKVIFLVRDPRGTMNSRYSSVTWCSSSPDCSSPETLCQDLQGDLKVAAAFEKLYPNRFLKVQYEDLASKTDEQVQKIMNYLGLEYTKDMRSFVANNTQENFEKPWSIKRKSSDRVALWKKQLPLEEVHNVQNACGPVLKSMKLEVL